ncbi:MAG: SDR family oxidoreductase [archaeon]|nr:SDR family oxidoreductase [archaeon]
MGRMDDKVALVGGNLGKVKKGEFKMGLGGLIAKDLANEGAQVFVVDMDDSIADSCAAALGDKVKAKACDLLKERTSRTEKYVNERGQEKSNVIWEDNPALKVVQEIVEECGKLDALVTNFDSYDKGKINTVTYESYTKLRDENLKPTFHLVAAVREQFSVQKKTKGTFAKVVMITSMLGKAGGASAALYSGLKGGIIGGNKTLAREFGRFANVNSVAIGPLSTKKMQGPPDRAKKNHLVTASDMHKMDILPEHITPMVTLLCSDAAAGIDGQCISIDGGLWLHVEV